MSKRPQDLIGCDFELKELATIDPPLQRIGFMGESSVGKTTLLAHLQARASPNARTENPSASVVVIQASPPAYFALVDAAGQQFAQQFLVAENADDLIVFLDHSESSSAQSIDAGRLREHEEALRQLAGHIKTTGKSPARIHFLLNKRDLWEEGTDAAQVQEWFRKQVDQWRTLTAANVSSAIHSNWKIEDITALINILRQWIR